MSERETIFLISKKATVTSIVMYTWGPDSPFLSSVAVN